MINITIYIVVDIKITPVTSWTPLGMLISLMKGMKKRTWSFAFVLWYVLVLIIGFFWWAHLFASSASSKDDTYKWPTICTILKSIINLCHQTFAHISQLFRLQITGKVRLVPWISYLIPKCVHVSELAI